MAEILGPQRLGPLTPLVGEWEGNAGLDVSFRYQDDAIIKTSYYERAWFHPIPAQTNGQQKLEGLKFGFTAWRHGEEAMDPFHDEVGYLLWEKSTGQIIRCFAVPRGLAILAGGEAKPDDRVLHFKAEPGAKGYGLSQNLYLLRRAEATAFESTFTFNDDGTFSYVSDLTLKLEALGKTMQHTDRNTLHKVEEFRP